ncbi:MAG: metal/formaldehyde-sensitive transcriptional repressor [Chlorobium limicola]|uniref:metal/formaldehyde-sensitive transcriptional repressor n=1 Tax=Chlorobium limicola TaxID=1092 RepID=UPI0023F1ED00|nr:metal/formaldehyde-sensitive transcriptional repressor [Chlorobium limicola]NTV21805.1 metal/formaldehyde-sensitive transcriptional repressor [Chlorobium limicola]
MPHTKKDKKKLLTRIRRIKGQTEALEKALEAGVECSGILQQIAAIRGAISGLMIEVLEGHIRDHLVSGELSEAQRNKDVEEVVAVIRSYLR